MTKICSHVWAPIASILKEVQLQTNIVPSCVCDV
jgi:hypothetical protein